VVDNSVKPRGSRVAVQLRRLDRQMTNTAAPIKTTTMAQSMIA
jgi:hypothetical protein